MANDEVTITMRRDTLVVISNFWHGLRTQEVRKPDGGERVRLRRLEGAIEKTLPEIFSREYKGLVAAEKVRLTRDLYGSAGPES